MNKKLILAFLIGALLLVGGGLLYFFKDQLLPNSNQLTSPTGNQEAKPKYTFEWQLWEDPAGFAFEYPTEIEMDKHPEDEINYAHLELASAEHPGSITFTVNDTEYPDIETWMSQDELVKDGNGLDTEVASMSAKRVALKDSQEIIAFIDWDQVLYLVDVNLEDREYWQPINNHVLDSFKLIPLEGESEEEFTDWLGGFETTGVDIVEPVEVIE